MKWSTDCSQSAGLRKASGAPSSNAEASDVVQGSASARETRRDASGPPLGALGVWSAARSRPAPEASPDAVRMT